MDQAVARARKPRSQQEESLVRRAKKVLPGGVLANLYKPDEHLFVADHGRDGRLYDKSGNEWVDYRCASGCLILGHRFPAVEQRVLQQISRGSNFTQILNEPAIELAEKVVQAIPSADQVRFALSGGEATFFAMRLARAFTGRDKILKFEGAYHGHGDHIIKMLPKGFADSRIGHPGASGIPRSVADDYLIAPFNDLEAVRSLMDAHGDEVAGIIVEPVLGFIPPVEGFLEGLRNLATKSGSCLIFDEVVTGFWTGFGGAQALYNIAPDITTLGKAFGGGYPISAVCARKKIMDHFDYLNQPLETVAYHGGSLYGHPVCAAASLATLQELEKPETYIRLNEHGERLRSGLREITARFKHVPSQVLGIGPTWHICFTEKPVQDYRSNMSEDTAKRHHFTNTLWSDGIHVMGRGYICLTHNEEDFERTLRSVDRAFRTF